MRASHVTIEPKTAGRFEQHGRVLAFVPDALKPGTIYTVTVARGITAGSGGKPMADDLRFQFETDKSRIERAGTDLEFADVLLRIGHDAVDRSSRCGRAPTRTRPSRSPPSWTSIASGPSMPRSAPTDSSRRSRRGRNWSNEHPIDTGPLTKVVTLDARFADRPDGLGALWTALPEPLPAGWYVVEHPSTPYPDPGHPPGDRHRLVPAGHRHEDPALGERPRHGRPARRAPRSRWPAPAPISGRPTPMAS